MRNVLLASACAVICALAASPSSAEGVAGSAGADFGNIAGSPYWDVNGKISAPLGWDNIGIQGIVGEQGAGVVHGFDAGGSLYWRGPNLRVAGTVTYNQVNIFHNSRNETSFGGGLEWDANPWLTASVQGGGMTGSMSGGWVGGSLRGYVCPDVALTGFVNYGSLSSNNGTQFGVKGEWLPIEHIPVSLGASYSHLDTNVGFHTDTWMVGVNIYLDDSSTLADHQRSGTLNTIGAAPSLMFQF